MAIRAARIAGLLLLAATLLAPWHTSGGSAGGMGLLYLWMFLGPPFAFVLGVGFVAWLLAIAAPRHRTVVATFRGFLLVLGLACLLALLLTGGAPGAWLCAAVLAGTAVAERRLGERGEPFSIGKALGVVGGLALVIGVGWIWWLTPKEVTPRRMGRFADRGLESLVQRLEAHHEKHGCYPREFEPSVDCAAFPRENARASVQYAECGLDDYVLGVVVQYKRDPLSMACGGYESVGFLTSRSGGAGAKLRFLAYKFNFFHGGKRAGERGRWSLWREGERGGGKVDWEGWRDALEAEGADAPTRKAAVTAIGRHPNRAMVATLMHVLLHDADEGVRGRAAWALGRQGDPWALDALRRAHAQRPTRETAWAIAQLERAAPDRPSRGRGSSRYDFDGWIEPGWRVLFGPELASRASEREAFEGPGCMRLTAGQTVYVRAYPRRELRYRGAVRVVSGGCEFGYLERFGDDCAFFNAFALRDGRVEFRGRPVGTYRPGEWLELAAVLDFGALTATVRVGGVVAARGVPIDPYRFESETRGPVQLYRLGVRATGEVYVDSVRVTGSGWSLG